MPRPDMTTVADPEDTVLPETVAPAARDLSVTTKSDKRFLRNFSDQEVLNAYNISLGSGLGRSENILEVLKARGLDPATLGTSFDATDPQNVDYENARDVLAKSQFPGGKGKVKKQVWQDKWETYKAELAGKKIEDYFEKNVQPTYDTVNEQIQKMIADPSVSAEEQSAQRSEMVAQVKKQEIERQKRVGAALGLAGNDTSSLAGTVLASSVAEEADQRVTEMLRRYGLDVIDRERQDQASELGLATSLSTSMLSAKEGVTSRNYDRVHGAETEMQNLIMAIRALNASQMEDEGNPLGGALSGALSGAASGSALGPWGMVGGGLLGGAGGYMGGAPSGPTPAVTTSGRYWGS